MKAYKIQDLIKKDLKTLNEDLVKLREELLEIKSKAALRKASEDTSNALKIRKQIARILTAVNQKENQEVSKVSSKEVKEK